VLVDGEIKVTHQEAIQRAFKILEINPSEVPALLAGAVEDQEADASED
jgi:hypothetical protein